MDLHKERLSSNRQTSGKFQYTIEKSDVARSIWVPHPLLSSAVAPNALEALIRIRASGLVTPAGRGLRSVSGGPLLEYSGCRTLLLVEVGERYVCNVLIHPGCHGLFFLQGLL